MEIIKYIFTDFWHWLGVLIFLVIIVDGIICNFFRTIINIVEMKKKLPECDSMDFPKNPPQGTIVPIRGKVYIFIKNTWIQISEKQQTLKNDEKEFSEKDSNENKM